ncbi:hypothetical protein [Halanaerobium salsuginis]|jgi:uncharacterized membrane protein YraQ (UPF0718 family)|uniref:Permease n=1 Tax=Halanaerobium salsuginis TaxID=29563 RepID=A0A1I4NHE0_9FIRM|nr:hypothetical protein [Halanaerobium salsuginis]SFM14765.1 hypothetical protein SAMN02983006_02904 [Halanaerobium salsuginis]
MLYLFTLAIIIILYIIDSQKTINGIKIGLKKLQKNIPTFLNLIILVALALYFISDKLIIKYLGSGSGITGVLLASFLGSVTFMPGFIAFPLTGVLLKKGVSYTVIAAFTTTLMLVGIVTFPLEKRFLGIKITILRNIICFVVALIVSALIGIFYGEVIIK